MVHQSMLHLALAARALGLPLPTMADRREAAAQHAALPPLVEDLVAALRIAEDHALTLAMAEELLAPPDAALVPAYQRTLVEHGRALLRDDYAVDTDDPAAKQAASIMAPRLFLHGRARQRWQQVLLDWNARVVAKAYALPSPDAVELAWDLLMSFAVVNPLVTHYRHVVTPHLAYTLDTFVAPLRSAGGAPLRSAAGASAALAQYTVVEKADTTLGAALGSLAAEQVRAVLAQVLWSLDAAWRVTRFTHGDPHPGNIMLRALAHEADTPYRNVDWVYVDDNDAQQQQLVVPARVHANAVFVELIDFGRASGVIRLGGPAPLLLPRCPSMTRAYDIGVEPDTVDPSRDVRYLALALLDGVRAHPHLWQDDALVGALAEMADLVHVWSIVAQHDRRRVKKVDPRGAPREQAERFFAAFPAQPRVWDYIVDRSAKLYEPLWGPQTAREDLWPGAVLRAHPWFAPLWTTSAGAALVVGRIAREDELTDARQALGPPLPDYAAAKRTAGTKRARDDGNDTDSDEHPARKRIAQDVCVIS
jgi:hypothetical protein